jgi:hypothetical protein
MAGGASAQVPPALVWGTARAAALVAAGQLAAVTTPAAGLTREVLKAMFIAKLKVVAATAVVLAALGAVAWQANGWGSAQAAPPGKPLSEVEALRKEVELMRLNLLVVLEKVRAQETELTALRGKAEAAQVPGKVNLNDLVLPAAEREAIRLWLAEPVEGPKKAQAKGAVRVEQLGRVAEAPQESADLVRQAEAALKALRQARDPEAKRRAAEALEKAARQLRGQPPPKDTGK